MPGDLFRPEAMRQQTRDIFGDVALWQPVSLRRSVFLILILFVAVFSFLSFASYEKKETVKGILVPDKGLSTLHSGTYGIVGRVMVQPGQKVKKNQPLVEILTEKHSSGIGNSLEYLLEQLRQKGLLLDQKIAARLHEYTQSKKSIKTKIASLQEELKLHTEMLALFQRELKLSQSEYDKALNLKKYTNSNELTELERTMLTSKMKVKSTDILLNELRSRIAENDAKLVLFEQQLLQDTISSKITKLDLERESSEIKLQNARVLVAPIDGVISVVRVKPGEFVIANHVILSVLPEDASLIAELYAPSRAIGFLKEKLPVNIRIDAFPYQEYGIQTGKVKSVATSSVPSEEIKIQLDNDDPVYIVQVEPSTQFVHAYGNQVQLQAHMQLHADLIIGRQSFINWILEPFYIFKGKDHG